jgi:hypothetical protein
MTALEQRCHETLERTWTVGGRSGVPFGHPRPNHRDNASVGANR